MHKLNYSRPCHDRIHRLLPRIKNIRSCWLCELVYFGVATTSEDVRYASHALFRVRAEASGGSDDRPRCKRNRPRRGGAKNVTIVIDGAKIRELRTGAQAAKPKRGERVLHFKGKIVMPGLIGAHKSGGPGRWNCAPEKSNESVAKTAKP